jgi:hypothetical protein
MAPATRCENLKKGMNLIMKFCKVSLFFALLVAVCLPVVAQTGVRADIPFAFIAAGKSLPAGHYLVVPASTMDRNAWFVCNAHDCVSVIALPSQSREIAHHSSLIFLQAGGTYSLVQIKSKEDFGRDVLKSKVKQTLLAEGGKYVEIGAE